MNTYSLEWVVNDDDPIWFLKKGNATVTSHRLETLWNNILDVTPSDDEYPVFRWKGCPPWFWDPTEEFNDEYIEN